MKNSQMSTLKGEGKENVSSLDKFVNHENPGNFVSNLVLDFMKSETQKTVKS